MTVAQIPPPTFVFHPGTTPLLLSIPHMGTSIPPDLAGRLTDEALQVPDTDWHLDRLYGFAKAMGASILMATHSRYVVDLNRPRDGSSLYPGQSVTGLCPVDRFDGAALYRPGMEPDAAETEQRVIAYWQPYHEQLRRELTRLRDRHGVAMLWDAHSIRSVVPRFFDGPLTDFNLGTVDGASCDAGLAGKLMDIARTVPGHSAVLNGRFKGGHITRHYGAPGQGIHAVQLELTQRSYMQESMPFDYLPERAERIQPYLRSLLDAMLSHARAVGR